MEFNEYQIEAKKTDQRKNATDEINRLILLMGMIGEIGSVAAEHKKRLRDGQAYTTFVDKFKKELGDVLWYVAILASDMEIKLEDVAQSNLLWTRERWADKANFQKKKLFDEDFEEKEQFPRELTVDFRVTNNGDIAIFIDDQQLGNDLNDNSHVEDGYKFHDVFHLAFMAKLGWSPVMRKLFNRKRKSNEVIDRIEDGARAGIIEEAISVMVYEHAKDHNFYEGIEVIDFDVLNTIKGMVRNLEARNISTSQWERAIIEGYSVYRELKHSDGGKVYLNLKTKVIKFLS